MKKKKSEAPRRNHSWIIMMIVTAVIIVFLWNMKDSGPLSVRPLDNETYGKIKAMIKTSGTSLTTVKIFSSNKRRSQSGTLIVGSDGFQVVVTAAHIFYHDESADSYSYIVDDKEFFIEKVCSHPKPGAIGYNDIAFCFRGVPQLIKGFAKIEKDMVLTNIHVRDYTDTRVTRLEGNVSQKIIGILFTNETNPLYIIPMKCVDGDSGGGFIGEGRFFVIKGNIPVGSQEIADFLQVRSNDFTLLSEL
jgi:hypothetical protein